LIVLGRADVRRTEREEAKKIKYENRKITNVKDLQHLVSIEIDKQKAVIERTAMKNLTVAVAKALVDNHKFGKTRLEQLFRKVEDIAEKLITQKDINALMDEIEKKHKIDFEKIYRGQNNG
jgi:ATP-dependent 26S proteasome regulatory subunit